MTLEFRPLPKLKTEFFLDESSFNLQDRKEAMAKLLMERMLDYLEDVSVEDFMKQCKFSQFYEQFGKEIFVGDRTYF